MLNRKPSDFYQRMGHEPLVATAAALKCGILIAILCGIGWIAASAPEEGAGERRVQTTDAQQHIQQKR